MKIKKKMIHGSRSPNGWKSYVSMQMPLIVFYTNNLNEIRLFTDFILPELWQRKSPKFLIVCHLNKFEYNDEIHIINVLKHAWKNGLLDFSIIVKNSQEESIDLITSIYYYNPFNHINYKKKLNEEEIFEIFPDKLWNVFGYAIHFSPFPNRFTRVAHTRQPYRKLKIITSDYFDFNFITKILNATIVINHV